MAISTVLYKFAVSTVGKGFSVWAMRKNKISKSRFNRQNLIRQEKQLVREDKLFFSFSFSAKSGQNNYVPDMAICGYVLESMKVH